MDPEHLNYYGTYEKMKDAYRQFVQNIPFYGFACLCVDHPEVQNLVSQITDRKIITYGLTQQAEICAQNIRAERELITFDVRVSDKFDGVGKERYIKGFKLPLYGLHNVQNALAAIAIAVHLDLNEQAMRDALAEFSGVKRRFTKTGESDGVTVIDDYGHHPVEIASVLKAARAVIEQKIVAVWQPHRYSRAKDLFDQFCTCFNDADCVIVADIFAAGEEPLEGISKETLVDGLKAHGHRHVIALEDEKKLPEIIKDLTVSGDIVICLGAGNVSAWANALPEQLNAIVKKSGKNALLDTKSLY